MDARENCLKNKVSAGIAIVVAPPVVGGGGIVVKGGVEILKDPSPVN
jgi:hypothetical protein